MRSYPLVVMIASAGCVTTGTFDAKVHELERVTADHDKQGAEREKELRAQLDDATALVGELKQRLEKLGQNVEKLSNEKGQISQGLADAKQRLEELRLQKLAAEQRAATFRELVQKLKSMIDAGQLKVVTREGRMMIALPNDVLFDSGRTNIKSDGQAALAQIAQALATLPDRHFLVSGYTDNIPIHTAKYPSNWELSTERAVEVVNYLIAKGMKPEVLMAAGQAEFDPVASNESSEGRAQNRRIEIVLQPNLSELPSLDEGVSGKAAKL